MAQVHATIAHWSEQNDEQHQVPGMPAADLGLHAAPVGGDLAAHVQAVQVAAPSTTMAHALLTAAKSRKIPCLRTVKKDLLAEWYALHRGIASAKLAKLPTAGTKVTMCSHIGMCVCGHGHARFLDAPARCVVFWST